MPDHEAGDAGPRRGGRRPELRAHCDHGFPAGREHDVPGLGPEAGAPGPGSQRCAGERDLRLHEEGAAEVFLGAWLAEPQAPPTAAAAAGARVRLSSIFDIFSYFAPRPLRSVRELQQLQAEGLEGEKETDREREREREANELVRERERKMMRKTRERERVFSLSI